MPTISVVIPFYKGLAHIEQCVQSVLDGVDETSVEVLVVDDCSPDGSGKQLDGLFAGDDRIKVIHRETNGGTLQARRSGVLASSGSYVMLIDQDDALVPGVLSEIVVAAQQANADILHFGAKVIAESEAAESARAGMEGFLTPPVRKLSGEEILTTQFSEQGNFDWHVHHKVYKGDFARKCWSLVGSSTKLALSDDLYLSFMLASQATSYKALEAKWYEYHLGRGETLSGNYSIAALERVSKLDAQALALLKAYVALPQVTSLRTDWSARLADAQDRLIEHVMNEMADNLSFAQREESIKLILRSWQPDVVAGELWRYVRDRAYCLYDTKRVPAQNDELFALVHQAMIADRLIKGQTTARYAEMHDRAFCHLNDVKTNLSLFKKAIYERRLKAAMS